MPIRSQPYDPFATPPKEEGQEPPAPVYGDQQEPPERQPEEQPMAEGSGIHQRKSEFAKRFADTNIYTIEKTEQEEIDSEEVPEKKVGQHKNSWLIFMVATIICALFLFMGNSLVDTLFGSSSSNLSQSIQSFISFSAPILVIIAAHAGTAGYFRFERVAWFIIGGFIFGTVAFFISTAFNSGRFNFGIYWIIIGCFCGGLAASITEFVFLRKYKIHKELQPLFIIGMVVFFIGGIFLVRATVSKTVELLSYQQVGKKVDFQLYEPVYLPDKYSGYDPKIIYDNGQVNIYYGQDNYPPPPVIDFLTGIEFIETKKVDSSYQTSDTSSTDVIFVDIDNAIARYTERRGRATLEWDENQTHIVLNVYSSITARDIFKIARELELIKTTK